MSNVQLGRMQTDLWAKMRQKKEGLFFEKIAIF